MDQLHLIFSQMEQSGTAVFTPDGKGGVLCDGCAVPVTVAAGEGGDGFAIRFDPQAVTLYADTPRARAFAWNALRCVLEEGGVRAGLYRARPSFRIRGIIEGFYGKPWTMEQRADVIGTLAAHGLNTYLYGPKDDPYHREKWREPYPEEKLQELCRMRDICAEQQVDFVYLLAPGLDIEYSSARERTLVLEKYRQVSRLGVHRFGLLLDDIGERIEHESDRRKYPDLVSAHIDLVNGVWQALRQMDAQATLCVCPTQYHGAGDEDYIRRFGCGIPQECLLMFTGERICSAQITSAQARFFAQHTNHKPLYWDNYPVNDMEMKDEFHVSPIRNRDRDLGDWSQGVIINPMESAACSKFAAIAYADYLWNARAYDPEDSRRRAAQELLGEALAPDWLRLEEFLYVSHLLRLGYHYQDQPSPGPHSEAGRLIQAKELDRLQSYLSESEDCFRRLQALPAAYRTEVQRWLDTALDFCVQARCALENRQKGAPVRAVLQPLCRYLTRKEDVMKEEAEQLLLLLAE